MKVDETAPIIQCQVMQENSSQCINNAWAFMGPIPKCRLHFAIDLANTNDHVPEGTVLMPEDKGDLDRMLKLKHDRIYGSDQQKDEER